MFQGTLGFAEPALEATDTSPGVVAAAKRLLAFGVAGIPRQCNCTRVQLMQDLTCHSCVRLNVDLDFSENKVAKSLSKHT